MAFRLIYGRGLMMNSSFYNPTESKTTWCSHFGVYQHIGGDKVQKQLAAVCICGNAS